MNLDNLTSIDQLIEFLSGTQSVAFSVLSGPVARYEWVQKTLIRFGYLTLSRADQGVVIRVLIKVSGTSRQQVTRLIAQYRPPNGGCPQDWHAQTPPENRGGVYGQYTRPISDCWRPGLSATSTRQ